ncbi:MFS transporter [Microbulbifer pacificus]|uniref:MFS transporter n=1 Tax=Microbulbifer pacificus TaxID=407164 RepID=A0AAU0N3Y2_9GAMM|nr:hypothetical protein [Microbulbifer pacificus]WOX06994.1 hypothetical protein R5R33_07645 [Microbulbifer pacificus]
MQPSSFLPNYLSTKALFMAAGVGFSCWIFIIQLTNQRLGADPYTLKQWLSILSASSATAVLAILSSSRIDSRWVLMSAGLALVLCLLTLPYASSSILLTGVLTIYGSSLGVLIFTMNYYSAEMERRSDRWLLSKFYGLFSLGSIISGGLLLFLGSISTYLFFDGILSISLILMVIFVFALVFLPKTEGKLTFFLIFPRGEILVSALLAAVLFFVESAILYWCVFVNFAKVQSFTANVCLTGLATVLGVLTGRFLGDSTIMRFGNRSVLFWGGIISIVGCMLLLFEKGVTLYSAGLFLIALGMSNVIPILFRRADSQSDMPPTTAVLAIGTFGYLGVLTAPLIIEIFLNSSLSQSLPLILIIMTMISIILLLAKYVIRYENYTL